MAAVEPPDREHRVNSNRKIMPRLRDYTPSIVPLRVRDGFPVFFSIQTANQRQKKTYPNRSERKRAESGSREVNSDRKIAREEERGGREECTNPASAGAC